LQVLMASPGDNLGTLTAFLHRYYDIIRDAETSTAMIAGHDVSEEMRECSGVTCLNSIMNYFLTSLRP